MAEVKLKNVHQAYKLDSGQESQALSGLDMNVAHGEYIAIQGPSGSGKTTLMSILGLLQPLQEGSYSFDGKEISTLNEKQKHKLRSHEIANVFQGFNLLGSLSLIDNVALSLESIDKSLKKSTTALRAEEALGQVGLLDELGLSAKTRHPGELSGGQRQRVAVARAIVKEPSLLLADEPTGNLDSFSSVRVLDAFDKLHQKQDTTFIVVTHDKAVSERADRVIHLRDGRAEPRQTRGISYV